jgi:hypothetical protein
MAGHHMLVVAVKVSKVYLSICLHECFQVDLGYCCTKVRGLHKHKGATDGLQSWSDCNFSVVLCDQAPMLHPLIDVCYKLLAVKAATPLNATVHSGQQADLQSCGSTCKELQQTSINRMRPIA